MFTLTGPGDESPDDSYDQLAARWKRFYMALKRQFPAMRLEYFKVVERQQRGHAHLHVLARGGYIPQRWLVIAAQRAGFGRIADIRAVGPKAAGYVSKYLAKQMGKVPAQLGLTPLPKWHRRASWSKGWAPGFGSQRASWVAQHSLASYTWFQANGRPVLVAMRLQLLGYELDEVDYGDSPPSEQAWELERQEPLRWKHAGESHRGCWLCASSNDLRARKRPHGPLLTAIPPAPSPDYELWAAE